MNRTWMTKAAIVAGAVALSIGAATTAQAAPGQGGCLRPLIEAGTITKAQADDLRAAIDSLVEAGAERDAAHAEALAGLVANGSLTQAQSDAIAGAKQRRGERPGRQGADGANRTAVGASSANQGSATPSYSDYSRP